MKDLGQEQYKGMQDKVNDQGFVQSNLDYPDSSGPP